MWHLNNSDKKKTLKKRDYLRPHWFEINLTRYVGEVSVVEWIRMYGGGGSPNVLPL